MLSSGDSPLPTAVPTRTYSKYTCRSKTETVAVRVEAPHALTRVDVRHAVDGLATAVRGRVDFPVAVLLKLLADAGDHRAEVLHAELALSLSRGEGLAHAEVVDDLTSLAEGLGSGRHDTILLNGLRHFDDEVSAAAAPARSSTVVLQVYPSIVCCQDALNEKRKGSYFRFNHSESNQLLLGERYCSKSSP